MKRLLYILLLVIGWNTLTAQTYQVNNQKIRFMNALGIPAKDTAAANWANAADTSIILIRPGDSTLWYRYKGSFRKVGTGGGTAIVDTVNTISSKPWRQKGVDSVTALISPRITDSLRSLVRLRASGSGGIQLQNSNGTNVADFGIANTTNGSIAGGWNVGGNSTISGTLGVTQKATFSDSIVGVNQRLSGGIVFNGTQPYLFTNDNYPLRFGTNNIERGVISGDGKFLYGTSGADASSVDNITAATFISAPNSNFGNVALFRTDGVGRGIKLISANFNNGTNTGTSISIGSDNIQASTNGNSSVSSLRLNPNGGSVITGGALTATAQGNNIAIGVDSSVTSTSYTLVLGDAGYLKRCDNASTITITVPNNSSVAFPIGTQIFFSQKGAGKVNLSAASGVNLRSEGNLLGTAGQNAVIGIIKVNTNDFLVVGNRG